jgi:hypothetical protein
LAVQDRTRKSWRSVCLQDRLSRPGIRTGFAGPSTLEGVLIRVRRRWTTKERKRFSMNRDERRIRFRMKNTSSLKSESNVGARD